jgi:hypothetical protein
MLFAVVAAVTLAAAPARAADVATAEVLFDDARKLIGQGRWAEACPKLEESQRLAPAIGTEFNLADCWEHIGRLASAWAAFLEVAERTHARAEAERERAARARAADLEPKLGRLVVRVGLDARRDGLEVRRDGELVRDSLWGVAVPVDQGDHRVEARAPGMAAWSSLLHVADGERAGIEVPRLTPAANPPSTEVSSAAPAVKPAPVTGDAMVVEASGPNRAPAIVALGASVALAGLGVAGIVEHDQKVSDYNANKSCPPIDTGNPTGTCADLVSSADTWKTLSIVGFVGSGAALVTGVILWVTAAEPRRAAALRCGAGLGALACAGTF